VYHGGPLADEDPDDPRKGTVAVDPVQTAPGWEIYARPQNHSKIEDGLIHIYRCTGTQDWRGRWIFEHVGGFTKLAFQERQTRLEYE